MRIENSIRNIKYNVVAQIINLIIQFINRTIFIMVLGKEYLGINGLFSNILTILSLADMGIGTVLIYSMYKPLAEKDIKKLKQLMNMYKKIYNIIAFVVFSIGLCLTPFLHLFIKNMPDIDNLNLIYLLYLINTTVSYLCIYKISIINADQKNYIVTFIQQVFSIISNIVMISMLLITKNFIVYLVIQVLFSVISNLYLSNKATKLYPFIKNVDNEELSIEEKKKIKKNTIAMLFHKVGGVVVSGTDSLMMSAMIGLEAVGIYSNYLLIINAIKKFTTIFFASITASVGNLNVEENHHKLYSIFKKTLYGNFMIYSFCSICLFCLLNPFIMVWLGKDYLFGIGFIIVLVLYFYVDGMRQTVLTFKDAMGLFEKDKIKPVVQSIVNIVLSIILTIHYGLIGIILGTFLSTILVCTFWEAKVLFRYGFHKSVFEYVLLYSKYIVIFIFITIITYSLNIIFNSNSIIIFIIHMLLTVIISLFLLFLFTFKQEEHSYFIDIFKKKFINFK